ncbi:hypothetical protein [Aurantimonas sp. VKM B-3413]|uniref:hypothetical protein n=1 Tax=Aurantimonas sp. VKM B-3413 TaxID=2779401 RepID=UPI001E5FD21B|nr:hypothetical protein [Aurantimonas sp. VKM B-3413]MCB8839630.1 hypothetical protein [Aurantimonas sp. VKM B-3413]
MSNTAKEILIPDIEQDVAELSRQSVIRPIFATNRRGRDYLILSQESYRLLEPKRSILDIVADNRPEANFDFDAPRLTSQLRATEVDLGT